jgi:ribonuclease BN (tRNA processing enzyme)
MQIRVLGCSGSIAAGCRTSAFLIDDGVLIDAGTGVGDLGLEHLARIDHIFISHSHLDHVLAIGLLADSVMRLRGDRAPIQVHALASTIDALLTHMFNGVIWPDFTKLPSAEAPVLRFEPVEVGQVIDIGTLRVEVLPASHTVPAVGYAVQGRSGATGSWVYTGDTGPNPALWARLNSMRVAALVIETAFRDDERELARVSRHLCPTALGRELAQLKQDTEVFITHIKPGETEAVMAEIMALGIAHKVEALQAGRVIRIA